MYTNHEILQIMDEWPYPLPDYSINHYIILNRAVLTSFRKRFASGIALCEIGDKQEIIVGCTERGDSELIVRFPLSVSAPPAKISLQISESSLCSGREACLRRQFAESSSELPTQKKVIT